MRDRGMIKWAPFDSVIGTKKLCYDILKEKDYIQIPILSQEQLEDIESNILSSYYSKSNLKITYYYMGKIYNTNSKIKYIDKYKNQIILNNGKILFFKQILGVKNI